MYSITQIEDAIIATLKASDMGGYCKKIDSYQIEGGDLEEQIRIFAGQLPCALVMYSEGAFDVQMSGVQDKEMTFSILVCAQSMRGGGSARRGGTGGSPVGAYKMLDDLRKTLTGSVVGLSVAPLLPVREAAEVNTKMFSAYSMEFKTSCRFTL
jgi:phage gp37-like protein